MLAMGCFAGGAAGAQTLSVLPVTVTLQPRQQTAILTLANGGRTDTSIQVRTFAWSQAADGADRLEPTEAIAVSPPLATIAAGRKQIVRLVLRRPPQDREATYRILLDQIPGPAQIGEVRVALRLSLPVFAEPAARTAPRLRFGLESSDGKIYLVATNDGIRHESVRAIALRTAGGVTLTPAAGSSPYVLPGATRRWLVANASAAIGGTFRLTATTERSGLVEQTITVVPPR